MIRSIREVTRAVLAILLMIFGALSVFRVYLLDPYTVATFACFGFANALLGSERR